MSHFEEDFLGMVMHRGGKGRGGVGTAATMRIFTKSVSFVMLHTETTYTLLSHAAVRQEHSHRPKLSEDDP